MNLRLLSACFSLAGVIALGSTDALAQRGGGTGRGMGGGMGGGYGGAAPAGVQRGPLDAAPIERGGMSDPARGASTERQATERQGTERANKTPSELLQQNTRLADNLAKLLPAGTDLQSAASGFKNLGEFVAAVHVSNNLGILFADLKTKIMAGDSLGEAIRKLRPDADAQVEARKARARAEDDLAKG
ncbi:MAG: hypothetical protein ACREVG_18705 [Burkholderiales bacterium]